MVRKVLTYVCAIAAAMLAQSCNGMFGGVYDDPPQDTGVTVSGQLYIDASDWQQWHYIDLKAVADSTAENEAYNPSSAWVTAAVPVDEQTDPAHPECGIYTYWYDVFGAGIGKNEFRSFYPTATQPEPQKWTFAVHRNNVRTNGGAVAATSFASLDEIPEGRDFLSTLTFTEDTWNEKDVWVIQDRMLLGLIGNQGIKINETLSSWLAIEIPPIPPAFTLNSGVFILRLADGTYGALQLENYIGSTGTKCCLTINYRYPL